MKSAIKVCTVFILLALSLNATEVKAQRPMHEIHSMLIFNFIKYIEWPDNTKAGDFTIAVYGDDAVYKQLSTLYANRKIKGQEATIRKVENVAGLNNAHIIYLSSSKSKDFDDLLAKFNTKPTVIITDRSGLGKKGASINFKESGGKLKFEINKSTFDDSNLKISTQLLNMGIII